MTELEMLEAEKYWCENCSNWDKKQVQMDGYAKCKLTGTLCFAQESGKECKFFNVSAENVIVSPCKVGEIVWVKDYERYPKIQEAEIIGIIKNKYGTFIRYEYLAFRGREYVRSIEYIGKTVFLTKEEAERALKGGEG